MEDEEPYRMEKNAYNQSDQRNEGKKQEKETEEQEEEEVKLEERNE